MNKKSLIAIFVLILIIISLVALILPKLSSQDFDGHFTMNVPLAKHYRDVAWCWGNGGLGSQCEYWEDNDEGVITGNDIVIYYYNNSLLSDGESNALQHAVEGLTHSYCFQRHPDDGNLMVFTNDIGMSAVPTFLVGKSSESGDEVVFVGTRDLDLAKRYANTIEFSN